MTDNVLDLQQLLANVGGDEALADLLLARMREDLPVRLTQLREALERADAEVAHQASHPLKGALTSVRALEAGELARQIDDAARDGDLETAAAVLPQLEQAAGRLQQYIDQRLA
ncbi:hypothetical protein CKO15_05075 [Halorhodospira abdelmalekii]|uniref:Hpt domain-containing protein n=1 Tax=Halorhodospira abdelmalekii TaxID=421629 RepID=UPI0019076437|nr:Hpt domain-containing protein [Halorhodospira abdelmalekii]MBK1734668.1 hypothetical protein [Halorhodospira abdelmalekii]